VPSPVFWDAAARHAHTLDDLIRLAQAAERRWRHRHAAQLYQQAVDAGSAFARSRLAWIRASAECDDDEQFALAAANARNVFVHLHLVWLPWTRELISEGQRRHAADTGDTNALCAMAWLKEKAGDLAGLMSARLAADAGNTLALRALAGVRWSDPRLRQMLRYGLEPDGQVSDPW
jgi:hypothetical protein